MISLVWYAVSYIIKPLKESSGASPCDVIALQRVAVTILVLHVCKTHTLGWPINVSTDCLKWRPMHDKNAEFTLHYNNVIWAK